MGILFKQNTPINETRISLIERIVERLARRARKKATGFITPYPISNAAFGSNVKGSVLRYMFPCEGIIVKGMVRLGSKLRGGVKLTVYLFDDSGGTSRSFIIEKKTFLVEPNIDVNSGDCLDISIEAISPEEFITEAWISFLWIPTVKDVAVKSYLLSENENDLLEEGSVT